MTENELLAMVNAIQTAKCEAVKEFVEKVKQKLLDKGFYPAIVKSVLDEAEKEMVGEQVIWARN